MNQFEEGVEDVYAAVSAGRAVREHGPFGIQIGDQSMQFVGKVVHDPVVTGSQILAVAGARPASDFLVFQVLRDGALEVVRPEETVDLRSAGAEKFLVFRSDRSFRFLLDERAFDWGAAHISGGTIKRLAGVLSETTDVWLDAAGGEDRVIEDKELVDLAMPGTERFITRQIKITIKVNSRPREVDRRVLTYWEIVKLAEPNAVPSDQIIYSINYAAGPRQNAEGTLVEGQSVVVKEGMKFYVTPTDKS
ncbi:multiubiquitin domain-containing protein [Roseateles amylovorans]|uniref:Multiubiquitin domain-containing protein n=1 Tax=Roseateles amylovorans TaxID=2978473 RepID=A0ABY6B0X3_9BURK|nr:multiubiquitin domain-containing protein [Roseateles amylovorans]UXH79049.1 multiubiquitin domain-containing protein [Roseateles amylovorans]